MKLVSWNIRGLSSGLKEKIVKSFVESHRVDMILLQESKLNSCNYGRVQRLWAADDFDWEWQPAVGNAGGLLMIWDTKAFKKEMSVVKDRFIMVKGKWLVEEFNCIVVNVYAPCGLEEKNRLWEDLLQLKIKFTGSWCFAGDFNTVRFADERKGYVSNGVGVKEFNEFVHNGELLDILLHDKKYTWYGKGSKRSRIDRMLLCPEWAFRF